MWFPQSLIVAVLISRSYGLTFNQHKYLVVSDKIDVEYVDHEILEVVANIYNANDTARAFNVSLTVKVDFPENLKFAIKAFKWVNDQYRDSIIQLEKPLRDILEMEMFDLQSLWVEHARPPLVWPLSKRTYTTTGWVPDSTKFPPNLPEGSYKVLLLANFPKKRKIFLAYWSIYYGPKHEMKIVQTFVRNGS